MHTTTVETRGVIWHYTKGRCIQSILKEGAIRLATANCQANERPAVWFSANQVWEPTTNGVEVDFSGRVRLLTKDETCQVSGGLIRIGVTRDAAPHNWNAYKRLSGVSERTAAGMKRTGYAAGARISEWYVSFEPVPREKWVAVEVWNGMCWEPCSVASLQLHCADTLQTAGYCEALLAAVRRILKSAVDSLSLYLHEASFRLNHSRHTISISQ